MASPKRTPDHLITSYLQSNPAIDQTVALVKAAKARVDTITSRLIVAIDE